MNKDILDLGKEKIGNAAKGIRTINRFIKLLNSMPESVRQKFYRKMAAKIVEDTSELKKYGVHIYEISGKVELSTLASSEEIAKKSSLELAEKGNLYFKKLDSKYIVFTYPIEKDGSEIVSRKVIGEIEKDYE